MKTLIESILADIDDTLSSGDNLFNEELETVQGIKNLALWEKYVSHNGYKGKITQYTYVWKCPHCLSSVGIDEYNAIELAMTYNSSDSPIGPAGWTITMHIQFRCSYEKTSKKRVLWPKLLYQEEFPIKLYKNTNAFVKDALINDIFKDYNTFSKFIKDKYKE
jgi:hypothetical protein